VSKRLIPWSVIVAWAVLILGLPVVLALFAKYVWWIGKLLGL